MEYTKENIEKAVNLFYTSETRQQAQVHEWLTEAQNSSQAWSFVWELLNPQQTSEVQFFAATTLHTKLLKHWKEIPEDYYELLKNRILQTIITYAQGPKLILNRLCITLSAYVIHTIPVHWPNAIHDLVNSFQPHNLSHVEPERITWILLEILSVVPEEFQGTTLATSRRVAVRSVLCESSKSIIEFVENCFVQTSDSLNVKTNLITYSNAVKCIYAWVQLGFFTIQDCSYVLDVIVDSVYRLYWNRIEYPNAESTEEQELIEVALETVSSVMLQPQTHKYPNHVIKHLTDINSKFGKILENEKSVANQNKDMVEGIYGLIINVADAHSKIILTRLRSSDAKEKAIGVEILNRILDCSSMPGKYPVDETNSSLPFGFWYTLQEDMFSISALECAHLWEAVKDYYRKLIAIMLTKSAYPIRSNPKWSLDDKELFRCYRQDVADTFMYCYNVLNSEMLAILQNEMDRSLYKLKIDSDVYWNTVEACLHAFGAVSECAETDNLYLPKLMSDITSIPFSDVHVKVLATALNTVGAYSEWLSDRPDILMNVVPMLLLGLENTRTTPNATLALKDVSRNCQNILHPCADHLLLTCHSRLQSGELKLAERVRIMHVMGTVISVVPSNSILQYMNLILGPSIQELTNLNNFVSNVGVAASIATRLKMISALFCSLNLKSDSSQEPILLVVQTLLPLLGQISEKYCNNDEVMSIMCTLFKHVLTSLMNSCKPVVQDILRVLLNAYLRVPNAGVLPLVKMIMVMFGKDETMNSLLYNFLNQIVTYTLQLFSELNAGDKLSEKSDIVEAFFSMLAHLLKRNNQTSDIAGLDFTTLFRCSIVCLALPEVHTLKACVAFVVAFISLSRENGHADIVQSYGETLVNKILACLGGLAPRSATDIMTEVFLILNKKYCDDFTRWLYVQLAQENFPSSLVTDRQKRHFAMCVLREKASKRKLCESITEFTLICRGIIKLEDGA